MSFVVINKNTFWEKSSSNITLVFLSLSHEEDLENALCIKKNKKGNK